jgi:hypothetical protein|tara:strand:+ start:271 stop:528 length:258 start_codon:yes stop_codon:yes gene_type:complete
MSKSDKAFEIQEEIGRKIDELAELGFEFMFYNSISSIRRLRTNKNEQNEDDKTAEYDAQREINEDHAQDSMTNDLVYNEHDNEWV